MFKCDFVLCFVFVVVVFALWCYVCCVVMIVCLLVFVFGGFVLL